MNETEEDILAIAKIRSAVTVWDDKDEKMLRWKLQAELDGATSEYDVIPNQIRTPPEVLVLLSSPPPTGHEGMGFWKPIIVTSRYYVPIPHQRVLRYFENALRARYPNHPHVERPYVTEETRMIMLFDVGETVEIMGDKLSFYMSTTNSYDLSLGIHTDGYIRNEAQGWGFFLGLAGKWQGTMKHYWDDQTLEEKMKLKIIDILDKKDARIEAIRAFAGTMVTPETFTKVGRALNCQKREKLNWDLAIPRLLPEGVQVQTTWVKNAGFTVTTINAPINAWQMLSMFAAWSESLSVDRRTDIAQRLFAVIEKTLKDEGAIP